VGDVDLDDHQNEEDSSSKFGDWNAIPVLLLCLDF
jgi:hypothetical protein